VTKETRGLFECKITAGNPFKNIETKLALCELVDSLVMEGTVLHGGGVIELLGVGEGRNTLGVVVGVRASNKSRRRPSTYISH
jgi:hypothetical protein